MKKLILIKVLVLSVLLCSCNRVYRSELIIPTPTPISRNITVKTYHIEKLRSLDIALKNAQVTFISWGRKEIKVETELRDSNNSKENGKQRTKLEDVVLIDCLEDNLTIKDQIKQKYNYTSKITIYCPCEVKMLSVKIENGDFSSNGDLISTAMFKVKKGNINLARYKGAINAEVLNGNFSVGSGKLNGTSTILCENGNINGKTEIVTPNNYKFEVNTGNIELNFPNKTTGDFICQGNVVANAFTSSVNGAKIMVSSKQGSINIKKY